MEVLTINLVKDLHHLIKKTVEEEAEIPKEIKNYTQMQIIYYLTSNKNKTIYQKDIGNALKLRKSSITEHLDYLEKNGIIERVQDTNDKRKNSIQLSEKSLKKENEIEEIIKNLNSKAIKDISSNDLELFKKVIMKMEDNLK